MRAKPLSRCQFASLAVIIATSCNAVLERSSEEGTVQTSTEADLIDALPAFTLFRFVGSADTSLDGTSLPNTMDTSFALTSTTSLVSPSSRTGWVHVEPDPGELGLLSPPDYDLRDPGLTLVLVFDPSVRGSLVSILPFSHQTQALTVVRSDEALDVSFTSSPGDAYLGHTSIADDGALLLTLTMRDEADALTITANGTLVDVDTVGEPDAPAWVNRVVMLAPALTTALELRELTLLRGNFGRSHIGAIVRDTAQRLGLDVTTTPELAWTDTDDDTTTVSPEFAAARQVLDAKCVSCHTNTHAGWARQSESYFINAGLVVPGNVAESKLYYRLTDSTGDRGPKDMPIDDALTESERAILATWIESL